MPSFIQPMVFLVFILICTNGSSNSNIGHFKYEFREDKTKSKLTQNTCELNSSGNSKCEDQYGSGYMCAIPNQKADDQYCSKGHKCTKYDERTGPLTASDLEKDADRCRYCWNTNAKDCAKGYFHCQQPECNWLLCGFCTGNVKYAPPQGTCQCRKAIFHLVKLYQLENGKFKKEKIIPHSTRCISKSDAIKSNVGFEDAYNYDVTADQNEQKLNQQIKNLDSRIAQEKEEHEKMIEKSQKEYEKRVEDIKKQNNEQLEREQRKIQELSEEVKLSKANFENESRRIDLKTKYNNDYPLATFQSYAGKWNSSINVCLLGKSKSGKSTMHNTLLDLSEDDSRWSISIGTHECLLDFPQGNEFSIRKLINLVKNEVAQNEERDCDYEDQHMSPNDLNDLGLEFDDNIPVKLYDLPGYGTATYRHEVHAKRFGVKHFDIVIFNLKEALQADDQHMLVHLIKEKIPFIITRNWWERFLRNEEGEVKDMEYRQFIEQDMRAEFETLKRNNNLEGEPFPDLFFVDIDEGQLGTYEFPKFLNLLCKKILVKYQEKKTNQKL